MQLPSYVRYTDEKVSGVSEMEKKYSNIEFTKVVQERNSTQDAEKMLNEIYMDMFLNCIHREQTVERLTQRIDEALDNRDKESFIHYTNQLLTLNRQCDE